MGTGEGREGKGEGSVAAEGKGGARGAVEQRDVGPYKCRTVTHKCQQQCCGAGAGESKLNCLPEPGPKLRINASAPDPYHFIKNLQKFHRKKSNKTVCDIKKKSKAAKNVQVGAGGL